MSKTTETGNIGSAYPSVAALAQDLGMCERSIRDALRRNEIPHIKLGKRYILPRAAIQEWLRNAGRAAADISALMSMPQPIFHQGRKP